MRVDELLERAAARRPDKVAVVAAGERFTYRQLDEWSNRAARALIDDLRVQRGDRVVIALDNGVEAVIALFGVLKAGGVFVLVSPRTRAERLRQVFVDSGAALLITPSFFADLDGGHLPVAPPPKRHLDSDLAALIYTSGSSGEPKGVMLTHRSITWQAAVICEYLENTSSDVILNVLPMAFAYGLSQLMTAFNAGATLVLERSFAYPADILETMSRERVTGFPLVPTMATTLLQQELRGRLPDLRYITNAAAALSCSKIRRLREAFPCAGLYSMYGLTECRVSYLPPDQLDTRPTSVGLPIPGTEAFVIDDEGRPVGPDVVGELVVAGPHVMRGYWNRLEATARALHTGPDGRRLFHTGDLFKIDRDGYLYFVDRKDDVIKTRGEKVAPRQIEELIGQLPGIAEVAVYGVPDEWLGEAVTAVITLTPGAQVTVERVKRHCLEHLDAFMVPATVEIRPVLPTTASGKVSRRALQAAPASQGAAG